MSQSLGQPDLMLQNGDGVWHKVEGVQSIDFTPDWTGDEVRSTLRSFTGTLIFRSNYRLTRKNHRTLMRYFKQYRKSIRAMHTEYHRRRK
jgi:hypothetical protein